MPAIVVDTSKVTDRRPLHFTSVDDILADAEQLARSPKIRTLGNWTPGQIFKHIAITMNGAIDGFSMHVSLLIRLMGRLFLKRRILNKGMMAGYKLSKEVASRTVPPESTTFAEGLQALRDVVQRWKTEPKRATASPFLGPMTSDEWTQLQCRHAELHFSFLQPE